MKKSQLIKLIKEELANKQTTPTGYEKKDGKLVPHFDKFDSAKLSSILTRIAKERPEEIEENSQEKTYHVSYAFRAGKYADDIDGDTVEVQATSEQEAIEKVKENPTKYNVPRSVIRSSFKAKLK